MFRSQHFLHNYNNIIPFLKNFTKNIYRVFFLPKHKKNPKTFFTIIP